MMNNNKKFRRALKNVFGFQDYLNELQEKAVENVFEAKRDVFIRGFGKSLCYQLPVMIKDNSFIIVITCNISYIKRYQEYFKTKNIKTNYLASNTSRKNRMAIEKDILSEKSTLKILFITPLKYESAYFKTILKQINKQRLFYSVIDQADNIIAQQENIKKSYENLDLRIVCVPIVAISGAANSQAQEDIILKFCLRNPKIYAMPIFRSNLYHDTWYINTLADPLAHLRKFIENCLSLNNEKNPVEKETWGVIICRDLEATISIAKFLTSIGIPAWPLYFKDKSKHLRNIQNIKVITVCDQVDMLTVTNSLVPIIARKLIRFVVYWYALPNIQKYYLQSSQARYFYGISYCRIYCQLEELISNDSPSFYVHDVPSSAAQSSCSYVESSSEIRSSLMQLQCRHKVYAEYFGDTFFACKNYCDVCTEKKKVEEKMNTLLELTHNDYLEKLSETLEFSKKSATDCDTDLQYECSKEIVSSQYETKNIESKETRQNYDDHRSLDTIIQYIEKNNNILDQKSQASPKSIQKTVSSGYQTMNIENEVTKEINDNHSRLETNIQCTEENDDKVYKKSQALAALDEIYGKLYTSQQSTSIMKLATTQSLNVKTVSQTSRVSVKKSRKSNNRNRETKTRTVEVITIDDETSEIEESFVQNKTAQLQEIVSNSGEDDDDVIFLKESKKRRRSQDSSVKRKKTRK